MSKLFVMVFFVIAAVAVAMMALGMCDAPASEAPNMSAEEENEALSLVEFSLNGSPTGETAVFLNGDTIIARLQAGDSTRISLTGNDRCGDSISTRRAGSEWDHAH